MLPVFLLSLCLLSLPCPYIYLLNMNEVGMQTRARSPPVQEEGPPSTSLQDILAGYSALEAAATTWHVASPGHNNTSPSTGTLPLEVAAALSGGNVLGASQMTDAPLTGSARRRPGAGAPIASKAPPEPSFEGAPQDPSEEVRSFLGHYLSWICGVLVHRLLTLALRAMRTSNTQDLGRGDSISAVKRGPKTQGRNEPAKLYGLGVTFKKSDGETLMKIYACIRSCKVELE